MIVRRFSSVGSNSPSWMSSTSVSIPRISAHRLTSAVRRRARIAPAIWWWPMSPLVTLTNLTLWPSLAHRAAVPPGFKFAVVGMGTENDDPERFLGVLRIPPCGRR